MRKIQPLLAYALELANFLPGGAEIYAYGDGEDTLVIGTAGTILAALHYGPGSKHSQATVVAEYDPLRGLSVLGSTSLLLWAARTVAELERPVPLIVEQVLEKGQEVT